MSEINFDDDLRYVKTKIGIESGKVNNLNDIFKIIPVSHIANKININPVRFNAKIKDPSTFRICELQALAKLINVEFLTLLNLIYAPPKTDIS